MSNGIRLTAAEWERFLALRAEGVSVTACARQLGRNAGTLYDHARRRRLRGIAGQPPETETGDAGPDAP